MAQTSTFFAGMLAFFIFCGTGLILTYVGGGLIIDNLHEMSVNGDIPPPPAETDLTQAMRGDLYWFINLFYFVCYGVSILGGVIFGQAIVKRIRMGEYVYR